MPMAENDGDPYMLEVLAGVKVEGAVEEPLVDSGRAEVTEGSSLLNR